MIRRAIRGGGRTSRILSGCGLIAFDVREAEAGHRTAAESPGIAWTILPATAAFAMIIISATTPIMGISALGETVSGCPSCCVLKRISALESSRAPAAIRSLCSRGIDQQSRKHMTAE